MNDIDNFSRSELLTILARVRLTDDQLENWERRGIVEVERVGRGIRRRYTARDAVFLALLKTFAAYVRDLDTAAGIAHSVADYALLLIGGSDATYREASVYGMWQTCEEGGEWSCMSLGPAAGVNIETFFTHLDTLTVPRPALVFHMGFFALNLSAGFTDVEMERKGTP